MQVTIIYNCDNIRVHKAGCRDAVKEARNATTTYNMEATTLAEVANDFYSDFIHEGSMDEAEALTYTDVLPCAHQLHR